MERYICIHGHFYQPPRENPWLEAVELQDSAYPYHDWNERITAECYAPNSASRILDSEGRIFRIVNNYSKISFNFGPTLLAWLEENAPDTYRAILAADAESRQYFSGHGSALAQVYGHMILPLANSRDKRTQVIWGLRDFERRFGRRPEGMWLPETAVDLETLDILAQFGIKFTILAPNQAHRVKPAGSRQWKDVSGGRIDPSTAYRLRLHYGREICLFFYDGPLSRALAFEDLAVNGENLARRLLGTSSADRPWAQLLHVATDGETYGHHRRHADMALAYAMHFVETNQLARITNYGEFLDRHPPSQEVQIFENSSWSCIHGVERWRSNCGCNSGMHPGWSQEWRAPLREAMDWLRDRLAALYREKGGVLLEDPWRARDEYISVILDRSPENVSAFLAGQARHDLDQPQTITVLKLLEMQRHAMLMYTSCGWFFDELSGIETVQVMSYAARALQLAKDLFGDSLQEGFLDRLGKAGSNLAEHRDGRRIYDMFVRPAMVTLETVGAHYAISSLFEEYPSRTTIYSHIVDQSHFRLVREGRMRLVLGRACVTSRITAESQTLSFGALHLGDQNIQGGVREFRDEAAFADLDSEITEAFHSGDIPALVHSMDRRFGGGTYSLQLLFRDQQRKIVRVILESALQEAGNLYRSFYAQHAALARFLAGLGIPLPDRFRMAIDFTLQEELLGVLSTAEVNVEMVGPVLEQIRQTGTQLDAVTAEYTWRRTIERVAQEFRADPENAKLIQDFEIVMAVTRLLPFEVNLWQVQNVFYEVMTRSLDGWSARAGDTAAEWLRSARSLADLLGVRGEWDWPREER